MSKTILKKKPDRKADKLFVITTTYYIFAKGCFIELTK